MTSSSRDRYVLALDALTRGRMAALVKARDWDLLAEVAKLAEDDAPKDLAVSDPALFETWRAAVTRFHRAGWTNMTPERVRAVADRVHEPPLLRAPVSARSENALRTGSDHPATASCATDGGSDLTAEILAGEAAEAVERFLAMTGGQDVQASTETSIQILLAHRLSKRIVGMSRSHAMCERSVAGLLRLARVNTSHLDQAGSRRAASRIDIAYFAGGLQVSDLIEIKAHQTTGPDRRKLSEVIEVMKVCGVSCRGYAIGIRTYSGAPPRWVGEAVERDGSLPFDFRLRRDFADRIDRRLCVLVGEAT